MVQGRRLLHLNIDSGRCLWSAGRAPDRNDIHCPDPGVSRVAIVIRVRDPRPNVTFTVSNYSSRQILTTKEGVRYKLNEYGKCSLNIGDQIVLENVNVDGEYLTFELKEFPDLRALERSAFGQGGGESGLRARSYENLRGEDPVVFTKGLTSRAMSLTAKEVASIGGGGSVDETVYEFALETVLAELCTRPGGNTDGQWTGKEGETILVFSCAAEMAVRDSGRTPRGEGSAGASLGNAIGVRDDEHAREHLAKYTKKTGKWCERPRAGGPRAHAHAPHASMLRSYAVRQRHRGLAS